VSQTKHSLINFIVHGAGQIVNLLAPFIVMPYIIKVCGVENWGKIGVATSLFIVLCLLIEFGSNLIGVKEVSAYRNATNYLKKYIGTLYQYRMFSTIILLGICIFTFLILNVEAVFYFGLLSLVAQLFNPIWFFQGLEDFKTINKIIIISKVLYVVLVFILVRKTEDYVYVVGILGFANTLVYAYYYSKIPKVFSTSQKRLLSFVKKNQAIVISNFAITFYSNAPVFIISIFLGDFYTGIYKISDMIITVFRSYLGVFFNVSYPRYCYLLQEKWSEGIRYIRKITGFNILFLGFVTTLLFLLYIVGIDYFNIETSLKEGLSLSKYLCFLPIIIALNIPYYQTLLYFHKTKTLVNFSLFGAMAMFVLGTLLTWKFHLEGTIVSIYIVEMFITLAMFTKGKPLLNAK